VPPDFLARRAASFPGDGWQLENLLKAFNIIPTARLWSMQEGKNNLFENII
jgi:hypothetical protein